VQYIVYILYIVYIYILYSCYCSWKLHLTALNWNTKIWQDATSEIHYMKQTENTKTLKSHLLHNTLACSCIYIVNSVHEYFAVTDSHLQISQHQASLKHENFTVSYHSYTTLLPQNILQLHLHFRCTLYSSNNLRFTKLRVRWNSGLPYMYLN